PILFFIASRREPHLRKGFKDAVLNGYHRALDVQQSFHNVRKYLMDEFHRIYREHHTMVGVPQPWPSSTMVEELVKNFSEHFIYVSTVLKCIDDKNFRPPDRLELILRIKGHNFGSPFNTLDNLYLQILSEMPLDSRSQLLRILTPMTCGFDDMDALKVEHFLELQPDNLDLLLRKLHSIINFPGKDTAPITAHHTSFIDFLNDPRQS
ncbi:hypothetical protein B0H14DRAFT_2261261, partial [Mycena olivaceomarginata]